MNPPEHCELDTSTGPDTLEVIQETLDNFWVSNPRVPEIVRMHLGIAVSEIGANIVEHASGGLPVRVRMELQCFPNEVQVSFVDDGSAAQVDLDALCLPDEMAERGRGLALAQSVLSRLTYHRNADGNHWLLVSKKFDAS